MMNKSLTPQIGTRDALLDMRALMGLDLIPVLMESVFVLSFVVIAVVMRMRKLTPGQFFWLVVVLLCIFFAATMMFYIKYS